jgi:hypothetical protein
MTTTSSAAPSNSTGTLTSVMRAATVAGGPKALRIGIVHAGKVIDERILDERDHFTIGPNEHALFVVPTRSLPPDFRMFERSGDHYRLQFLDGMTGRIALEGGTVDLQSLRERAHTIALPNGFGFAHQVALTGDARGKISIGDVTILFQLVVRSPALGKPQLPTAVKAGLGNIDWRTSIIAAFSFLFHFGAVGTVYSDWMDPVIDDEVDAAQLVESLRQLPAPPTVEHPKDADASPASAATTRESPRPVSAGASGRAPLSAAAGGNTVADSRAHQISSQLATLEMQVLTSLNSGGPSTSIVLSPSSQLPLGMLEAAAASSAGVSPGVPGLELGSGSGTIRPGSVTHGFRAPSDTSSVPTGAGSAIAVRPPSGSVALSGPIGSGGAVANANAVVAAMAAGFRRCYNIGLTHEDPTMKGTLRITARIGPNGEVLSASASGGGTLSPTVIGCLRSRVASSQFAPPEGGGATLLIPVTVYPQ